MAILFDSLLTERARPLNKKMVVAILFLLTLVDVSVSTFDPTGFNSYFTTEHSDNIDDMDAVDPSGWNYNRGTKGTIRNNNIKNDRAQQLSMFCQRVLEKGISETNPMIEDEINTAVKGKIAEIFNKKEDVNANVAFIRRFISILLSTADLNYQNLEEGSTVNISGVIEIKVSPEHLKILTDFVNSEVNVSMRELDSILSTSVHRKNIPTFSVSESIEHFFFIIRQKEIWLPVVLGFIVLFVYRLLLISNTNTRVCTSLLFLILTVSYVMEYYKMYKEVEIKQKIILDTHSEIPRSCDPRNQQWWSTLFKSLVHFKDEKQECVEYHKALLLDPFVEVSPSRVLSNILSDFVLNPFSKVGEAIAAFTSGILGGLPVIYGWAVLLGSSVAIFALIALALVILIGGRINFSWPFSGVSISSHRPPQEIPSPAAPPVSAAPVTRSTSQPVLEAVSGMNNFVLMDADSLSALVLRAQTSMTTVHSGVQELNRPPRETLPSKPSSKKSDFNEPQQKMTEKEESDLKTSSEKQINNEDVASVVEKNCEPRSPDNEPVEVSGSTIEVIKSDLAPSVLEDTTDSKSRSFNMEKYSENVKKED